ncbi:MAG: NAD-binding protein [Methanocellales archaeon]
MYIIIVGLGGIGRNLVDISVKGKNNVVIIDLNEERCKEIATKYDVLAVCGDATSKSTLIEAGGDRADAIIATTSDDAVNLMTVLMAKELGIKHTVAIVNEREHVQMFKNADIHVLENPDAIVARYLYSAIRHPGIKDFVTLAEGKAEIFKVVAEHNSNIVGKTLSELSLPKNALIVAIERKGDLIVPKGDIRIESEDVLHVFSRIDELEKTRQILTG